MDELPPDEFQDYTHAATKPYLSFDSMFKGQGRTRCMTQGWMRSTHTLSNSRQMSFAQQSIGQHLAATIMALTFRSGVIAIKAEVVEVEDGEIIGVMEVGSIVSYNAHNSKFFWPALVGYINDSESLIAERQQPNQMGEAVRQCQIYFERHLRKYSDSPPSTEESVVSNVVRKLLD